MMRRPLRVLVVLLTIAVTAGVVWRATMNEKIRGQVRLAAQQADAVAADAIYLLVDLRSSLHAYVAPGQGETFWSGRARGEMTELERQLTELERASTAANHPLAVAKSSLEGLVAVEARILSSVKNEQPLVAGDMIFTEARDLIDKAVHDLSEARQAMARATSAQEVSMANEQSLLAGALMAVWIFALILLAPIPGRPAAPTAERIPASESTGLSLNLHVPEEVTRAPVVAARPLVTAPVAATPIAAAPDPPPAPAAPVAPAVVPALESLASLCTDIARVEDVKELGPLLGTAATLLGARGLVVWLVSNDGRRLMPAVSHGYDDPVMARMGSIGVDDHNLTAAAFRNEEAVSAAPMGHLPAAIAVPLRSASGASGVLAVELTPDTSVDRALALATVIAAQLTGLFPARSAGDEVSLPVAEERGV